MENTMLHDGQSDREPSGRYGCWACRVGAAALLFLGLFVSYNGLAQALIPDHRSPDGTCQGKPEPPSPATGCETKLCTNDGDWMCCNKCTAAGGYCCNLMEAFTSQGGRVRVPGGQLQIAPGTTTSPSTPKFPKTGTTTAPIMRRGVEGEQGAEPESGTEKSAPGQSEEKK
jgi:hypothetical protein